MSPERINPYAPSDVSEDHRTRLSFDGVIEERDYADLLPRRNVDSVIYAVLIILLGLTSLVTFSMAFLDLVAGGWDPLVIPVIAIALVTGAGWFLAIRFRRPMRRARRMRRRHPDLFGTIVGQLNDGGLGINDGVRRHWFGPQQISASSVSKSGMRIRFDEQPDRFLALTARMFDAFDEGVALRIQRSWRDAPPMTTESDEPGGLDLWHELAPTGEDAIAFRGSVTVSQSCRVPLIRKAAISESAVALTCLLAGSLGSSILGTWMSNGALTLGFITLVSSVRQWLRFFRGVDVQAWSQRGWVSQSELAIVARCVGTKFPVSEIDDCTEHGDTIVVTSHAGAQYFIGRDQVQSDEEWTQIKDRLECTTSAS